MVKVVVLGAHTALGKNIIESLNERDPEAEVVGATVTDHLEPNLVLIDESLMRTSDLFVLAFEGGVAQGLVAGLRRLNKRVIDATGRVAEGPWVWPGQDADAARHLEDHVVVRISLGWASAVAGLTTALQGLGPTRVSVVCLESAAGYDQPGMEALSAQVRSVFAMQDQEAAPFEVPLAFNVIPKAPEDNEELAAQISDGLKSLGGLEIPVTATRVLVPTFSGEGAVVELTVSGAHDPEVVADLLDLGRGFRVRTEPLLPVLDAVGRDDILTGRIRSESDRIVVWLALDRLRRGSATQVALLVTQWLERQTVTGAGDSATS